MNIRKLMLVVISFSVFFMANSARATDPMATCADGGVCKLGDIGPGGGVVFFVMTPQTFAVWKSTPVAEGDYFYDPNGWKYLEVAPKSWSGLNKDPQMDWCNKSNTRAAWTKDLQGRDWYYKWVPGKTQSGFLAGTGFSNTEVISQNCSRGASNAARSYRGGGQTDWYLPRITELNQLAMYAGGKFAPRSACCIKDFPKSESASFEKSIFSINWGSSYWISSFSFGKAPNQNQSQGRMSIGTNQPGNNEPYVRPIRAF
jgi:hypothetical protein